MIAEIGTIQLEFLTLALHTGKKVYAEKAQIITDFIDNAGYQHGMYLPGLYPSGLSADKGRFTDCTYKWDEISRRKDDMKSKKNGITDI